MPTMAAMAAVSVGAGLAAVPSVGGYGPAVQVQAFEPAFYTSCPTWSVLPYSPALVSVAMPVYGDVPVAGAATAAIAAETGLAAASLAAQGVADGVYQTAAPEFVATSCGPCANPFSPMPPSGFSAWRNLLRETNAPYDSLIGAGYGWRRT
jgi:hypothetical protein